VKTSSPVHVGGVLFEGFELLDFYGPLEMFSLLGDQAKITVVAEKAGPARSSGGPCGMADAPIAGSSDEDARSLAQKLERFIEDQVSKGLHLTGCPASFRQTTPTRRS